MDRFLGKLSSERLSKESISLITNARKTSTSSHYESSWRKWDSWCRWREIESIRCPLKSILDFLTGCFHEGYETTKLEVLGQLFLPITIQFRKCQWDKMTESLLFSQVFLTADLRNQSLTLFGMLRKFWIFFNFRLWRESSTKTVDIKVNYASCISICWKSIRNSFSRFKVFGETFNWVYFPV